MDNFLIGVVSGVFASAIFSSIVFFQKNRTEIIDWIFRKNRYSHLSGEWHQYHLTNDKTHQRNLFWLHHNENICIGRLAKVTGKSTNNYKIQLEYGITGKIDHDSLIINYINMKTNEKPVMVYIDNVLSGEELHGVWIGYDFDKSITVGPIIYSREPLELEKLNHCIRNYRVNILNELPSCELEVII